MKIKVEFDRQNIDFSLLKELKNKYYNLELISRDLNYLEEIKSLLNEDTKSFCQKSALVVDKEILGSEDFEHGIYLIKEFFKFWSENTCAPTYILLFSTGIKLIAKNSPVLEYITKLKEHGSTILYSTESAKHFNFGSLIEDKLASGVTMNEIIKVQMSLDKVIKI